jgi:hypothetical protein
LMSRSWRLAAVTVSSEIVVAPWEMTPVPDDEPLAGPAGGAVCARAALAAKAPAKAMADAPNIHIRDERIVSPFPTHRFYSHASSGAVDPKTATSGKN